MSNKTLQLATRLLKIAARKPSDLKHVLGIANWAAGEIENTGSDTRMFQSVNVLDICTGTQRYALQTFPRVGASVSPMESLALAALSQHCNAKRIFEFGTYKGVSTTQLALNVGPEGIVFTLDLPEDHPAYSLPIPKPEEREIASERGKGILIPADLLDRVSFLRSDSASFDTGPYLNSMDLVFVDAAHSYEYVKNDSEKGWEMLRTGGVLAWHDCNANHPDVVRYLKDSGHRVSLVTGTALAFTRKP